MSSKRLATNNNQVPEGYKKTEVGVIPEEWNIVEIGHIAKLFIGKDVNEEHFSNVPDNKYKYPVYSNTVDNRGLYGYYDYAEFSGDSLTVIGRGVGLGTAFSRTGGFGAIGRLVVIFPTVKCDHRFLADYINNKIDVFCESSGIPQLTGIGLAKYKILLPTLPEQKAIAQTLSDVDALIAALDKLIAKKRNIKTATMQQLLTGKTRLPGFGGEWETKMLGELGIFSKGAGIKKDDVLDYGLPCIRYGEIYTRHHDLIKNFYSFISQNVASNSHLIKSGDLLFTGSGETSEEIGKCVAFIGDESAYAGGDIVIFSPKEQDSMFLGYLMNHESIIRQKSRMGQGDAVVHIQAKNLAQLQLYLPPVEEQKSIAQVLSDINTEITALEKRRAKTQAIKQGMMQELLTGKTRIIDN